MAACITDGLAEVNFCAAIFTVRLSLVFGIDLHYLHLEAFAFMSTVAGIRIGWILE